MRVALAQINPTVGDIPNNARKILDFAARARQSGADLVVFPELSLLGYPPKDLLLKPQFIDDSLAALDDIARQSADIDVLVGYAQPNHAAVGRPLLNAMALLRGGRVASKHFKTLLPTYDVFDESRYFEPGPTTASGSPVGNLIDFAGTQLGISICEDLWNDERLISRRLYHQNPIADLHAAGADMMINASASPYVVGKQRFREELFCSQVARFGKPLVYVNQVGGNDDLVFDGNSMVFDASGRLVLKLADFAEDLQTVDLATLPPPITTHTTSIDDLESIFKALVLGLTDYTRKTGFKSAVIGLSGGIDSALVCALAVAALGSENVVGVAMPSRYSSDHSINDAKLLAESLNISFTVLPIAPMHNAFEAELTAQFKHLGLRHSTLPDDLAEQNVQARIRGVTLMAISNKFNHLLLTTGNKSEIATGYCTLYGDMCGGLAVISDVPKTTVWALSRWINTLPPAVRATRLPSVTPIIPINTIEKVPSAELKPNQTDQDSLPPYDLLDQILHRYIDEEKGARQIIAEGFDATTVNRIIRMVDRSEYKRRQAAPGIKVTTRAFGTGRRMPIAQNYKQG